MLCMQIHGVTIHSLTSQTNTQTALMSLFFCHIYYTVYLQKGSIRYDNQTRKNEKLHSTHHRPSNMLPVNLTRTL